MNPFHRLHALRMANDADGYAMAEMAPRFQRIAQRHENGTAPHAVSAYQLFQTPPHLAARMVALLDPQPGHRILEPSAGLGRLLDALEHAALEHAPGTGTTDHAFTITAVELAPSCARELYRQNRAGIILKQRDFLTLIPNSKLDVPCSMSDVPASDELPLFDRILMNPPFHIRDDIKHIQHALKFLRPGGRLVALCMDTPHRRTALEPLGEYLPLPPKTFASEGTNVNAALVIINAGKNGVME